MLFVAQVRVTDNFTGKSKSDLNGDVAFGHQKGEEFVHFEELPIATSEASRAGLVRLDMETAAPGPGFDQSERAGKPMGVGLRQWPGNVKIFARLHSYFIS
jgi:hypothetical protein